MFEHKTLQNLDDYFKELNARHEKGVFFYRINGYNEAIRDFISKYYEEARLHGVVIEGKIPNPDEKNLEYYEEIMGNDFGMSMGFLLTSLGKWLPRMNDYQKNNVASAIYDTLEQMRKEGKNENMLRNAYIKFMCWLYYKFERIVNRLGENQIPKILYEGDVSKYELKLLSILSGAGCDIVLLQYQGDDNYRKLDAESKVSLNLTAGNMQPFPQGFSLRTLKEEKKREMDAERLYGQKPQVLNCTNAWIKGNGLEDLMMSPMIRGNDSNLYYNCFYRINGVQDKLTYLNELYQFQLKIKQNNRKIVIVEYTIPKPTMEEINAIRRQNYSSMEQMLMDIASNFNSISNLELQRIMRKAFLDILLEVSKSTGMNLNKLTNKAVYLLCWLKRYQGALFSNWKMPEIGCFVYLGGCKDENEAMLLRCLARLPVDVLILNPGGNVKCCLEDNFLFEQNYTDTMVVENYPVTNTTIQMGTAAYHAERELDSIMYQDSGVYRNRQFQKANTVTLQTMYEEIAILWDEELKYRPNFSITDGVVNIPVIFAKVSGVKDGMLPDYWSGIKSLIVQGTFSIHNGSFIKETTPNPVKPYVTEFFKNNRLQKEKIKMHKCYQYGFLREEMQEHILDKLQLLIESKMIKGTFENGMEYTIIATILNLNRDILREIQKFDFTKKNPQIIYINTTENMITLEDSIMYAFLNLVGFDIIFFVPTGYQNVEKYYAKPLLEEHQIGDYMYDLRIPDFRMISSKPRQSWREKIFKRGN
ncbi:MAG: hypothetical protein IJA27_07270 [Lachnospiraceae bacterium]|nr:hypothetical protein [Lachnospiraceae bacterium]